jgi:hypothetical protein
MATASTSALEAAGFRLLTMTACVVAASRAVACETSGTPDVAGTMEPPPAHPAASGANRKREPSLIRRSILVSEYVRYFATGLFGGQVGIYDAETGGCDPANV